MPHQPTLMPHERPPRAAHTGQRFALRGAGVLLAALVAAAGVLSGCAVAPAPERSAVATTTPVTVIATAAPSASQIASESIPSKGAPPVLPGYRLVFADEFNDTKLDARNRWITSLPWGRTNSGEAQYYTPKALREGGGMLRLIARRVTTSGKPYASGAISAKSHTFTYGHIESRLQVPAGTGLWPAIWLVTTVPGLNDEIDIMEILGSDPSQGYAVLHHGTTARKGMAKVAYRNPDFSVGFHTFTVDWEPGRIVWYVDGLERHRVEGDQVPSSPMRLITSLTVGGSTSWSGAPDRHTQFPAEMKVDYIRVYQRR